MDANVIALESWVIWITLPTWHILLMASKASYRNVIRWHGVPDRGRFCFSVFLCADGHRQWQGEDEPFPGLSVDKYWYFSAPIASWKCFSSHSRFQATYDVQWMLRVQPHEAEGKCRSWTIPPLTFLQLQKLGVFQLSPRALLKEQVVYLLKVSPSWCCIQVGAYHSLPGRKF